MTTIFERKPGKNAMRAVALCLALAGAAYAAAEGKKAEEGAPIEPEPPRVVAPLPATPLPPEPTDPSWLRYREGLRLFEEKRLGEALDSFKKAITARAERSDEAVGSIDAAMSERGAKAAQDSMRALVEILAERDLSDGDLSKVREASAGSLSTEMSLIAERRPSGVLEGFIRAARLVLSQRGGRRVGDSLAALKREAASLRYYPEAEYAIGRIYLAEGELDLAELQIRRAVDMAESLDVPAEKNAMLEELAEVYRAAGKERDYELALREVADASELFSKRQEFLRVAMERTLTRDGFDKFMLLYRIDEGFARSAYSKLGNYYLERGRPLAVLYLAASVNIALSDAIAAIRAREPGFAYSDIQNLLDRMASDASISRYAREAGLYRDMALLGESLALVGARDSARGIWRALVATRGTAPWDAAAAEALARPAGAPGPYPRQPAR